MEKFDFEHAGLSFRCEVETDNDIAYPWREYDVHGVIRETHSYYGRPEKKPSEVILLNERNRPIYLYDVPASIKKATLESWGLSEEKIAELTILLKRTPTKKEIIAESVRQNMEYVREWLIGDRFYEQIEVYRIDDEEKRIGESAFLSGIESGYDKSSQQYIKECAFELAGEIAHLENKETKEREYWEERDVLTIK